MSPMCCSRRLVAASMVLAWCLLGQPHVLAAEDGLYQLSYQLEAQLSSAALDATVRASTRLEMTAEPSPGRGLTLSLLRLAEPAWKYYRVDPAGPMGGEAKLGAVVTLPAPTWDAVDAVRLEIERLGSEQHRLSGATREAFDGAFGFLVIGPERGRFTVELDPWGGLLAARDQLTDRWISGELDPLLKRWGKGELGYWFWNHGESRPPSWEPNTVRALVTALELWVLPIANADTDLPPGAEETTSFELPRLGQAVVEVLSTLVPKSGGRFAASGTVQGIRRRQRLSPHLEERTYTVSGATLGRDGKTRLDFERRQRFTGEDLRLISDQTIATLSSDTSRVVVRVGVERR